MKDSLLDSVSSLDMTAYLDRAVGLFVLSLQGCELADGATAMNLFKGIRNNKSLTTLKLRGAALNAPALKVTQHRTCAIRWKSLVVGSTWLRFVCPLSCSQFDLPYISYAMFHMFVRIRQTLVGC